MWHLLVQPMQKFNLLSRNLWEVFLLHDFS